MLRRRYGLCTSRSSRSCLFRIHCDLVQLRDADTDDRNPYVVQASLNKGNRQIAHGIDRVLRPLDLP